MVAGNETKSTGVSTMAMGMSLHVGVNYVDTSFYGTEQELRLDKPESDARAMSAIAEEEGLAPRVLLTGTDATRERVLTGIARAAEWLMPGDLFLLSYSGHGAQVRDDSSDERGDGMDEVWVLYDSSLKDDDLARSLAKFRSGVRIVIVTDCCHFGGLSQSLPLLHRSHSGGSIPSLHGLSVAAEVVILASCGDAELADENSPSNLSLFTHALMRIRKQESASDYGSLYSQLFRMVPTARFDTAGPVSSAFLSSRPFSIAPLP
jgi:hypothetical protein